MSSHTKINSLQYLSSINTDASSVHTKIARTLLHYKSSCGFEMMLILLEYLQLMSIAVSLVQALPQDPYYDQNPIFKTVVFLMSLFNPRTWLYSQNNDIPTLMILVLLTIMTIAKYLFYLYVFLVAAGKVKNSLTPLLNMWRIIFKTQTRVLCFFSTSLWVGAILSATQNGVGIAGINKNGMIVWSGFMIALEYVFSFFIQSCYCYLIPTKSSLSSRDNYLEVTTLTQKLIFQLLMMTLPKSLTSISRTLIYTSISLFFTLFRDIRFFRILPLYNFSALMFQGDILMVGLSLNISSFLTNILNGLSYSNTRSFFLVIWAILSLLTIKMSRVYLKRLQLSIVNPQKKQQQNFIIHRIQSLLSIHKSLKESKICTRGHTFSILTNLSIANNLDSILNSGSELKAREKPDIDMTSKESLRKAISEYLDNLCKKYPKNDFLKLYTAYLYTTKLKMLGAAAKIANDLQKSESFRIAQNASLLICHMEAVIEKGYKNHPSNLDLLKYFRSRSQVAQLEQKVLKQIGIQQKLYQEILNESPDLAKIFDYSQIINRQRKDIETKTKLVFNTVPEYYLRPLTICTLYHSLLTFSVDDYLYYDKKYNQIQHKYKSFYKQEDLCQENMFQDSNILMIASGKKHECGKISFITKSVESNYGRDAQFYLGQSGAVLALPYLKELYLKFYEYLDIKGPQSLPNTISRGMGHHIDGYIFPLDFHFSLHPFTTQGLYVDAIMRRTPTKKEHMLILENGDIEGATFKLAKRLGLLKSQRNDASERMNVRDISDVLSEINDAFNIVKRSTKNESETQQKTFLPQEDLRSRMSLETAQSIYSLYSNQGKIIHLSSSLALKNQQNANYSYHCTATNSLFGLDFFKYLTFEDTKSGSQDSLDEHSTDPIEQLMNKIKAGEDISSQQNENCNSDLEDRFDDEKQSGWIDFRMLESKTPQRMLSTKMLSEIPDTNTASALTFEGLTTTRPLMTEQKFSPFNRVFISSPRTARDTLEREDKKENKDGMSKGGQGNHEPSVASVTSKRSKQKKITRAFRAALETRYFPMFFKAITVTFYLLFVAIFVTQLIFQVTLDQGIQNLNVGKNILNFAAERSYYLAMVHTFTRLSWSLAIHEIGASDLGIYSYFVPYAPSYTASNSILLSDVNKQFFDSADMLSDSIRQSLFAKDIKLISNDGVVYLNNFQAIDRIVEATLHMANLIQSNSTQAEQYVSFIVTNDLNDIYAKNQNISISLISFFANEKESIDTNINIAIIITSVFAGGILLVLTIIAWRKCREEKLNMSAVTRINNEGIRAAFEKINILKDAIENESPLVHDDDERQNTEFLEGRKKPENLRADVVKKEHQKTLNAQGILRRYLLYIGRVWIFTLLIAIIAIVNCVVGKGSLEFFTKKYDQLTLISNIKGATSLTAAAQRELFSGNGSTLVYNYLSPVFMAYAPRGLNSLKSQLASAFMNNDFTYDPVIAEILFSNGCPIITDSYWQDICNQLQVIGVKTSLIYLITDFENIMTDQLEEFKASNKTSESLVSIEMANHPNITSEFFLINTMCDIILELVDEEFESEMKLGKQHRESIFVCLLIMLVILSFLVWIYVLRRLADYDHQFKIVLSVLPPNLVLSNFVLKSFLMKTSKDTLNSIKNAI